MRILIINWRDILHPQAGGAEVHVHETFKRLAASGHKITLLCSKAPGQAHKQMVDGIETLRVGNWQNFNFAAANYYLKKLRRIPFDVVVDDVNKIPFYAPLFVRRKVLLLVPHLFGTTVFREAPFPLAAYVYLWERAVPLVYRNTPSVAISESTKQDLVERGLDPARIRVVQCGVDHGTYRPAPSTNERSEFTFLYLGRLKRYKSIDTLFEAAAILKEKHGALRVKVAGVGDDLSRLKSRAEALGIDDQVCFLGFVSLEEKVRLLQTAYAMVVPSPKEGWGLTAIEANACGTPVLASRSPGLVDSVKHGKSGLHFSHGDRTALAEAMDDLISNPDRREKLSRGALEWASGFNWDKSAQSMLDQLERAAKE